MLSKEKLIEGIKEFPLELMRIIDSVYLYGSMARGDTCEDSDCDLLVAIDDCDEHVYENIILKLKTWHPEWNCEIALYQMSALKQMQLKGSLFLWHIKKEGIELYSKGKKLKIILNTLPKYNKANETIAEYIDIMKDIENDNSNEKCVIEYNLSVMATLIRNVCIVCCYIFGDYQFGRISPVKTCALYWKKDFPIELEQYEKLYLYRTAYSRNLNIPTQNDLERYYEDWKNKTSNLLNLALLLLE